MGIVLDDGHRHVRTGFRNDRQPGHRILDLEAGGALPEDGPDLTQKFGHVVLFPVDGNNHGKFHQACPPAWLRPRRRFKAKVPGHGRESLHFGGKTKD